jgi:predicted Zn-ribbon and HTH transcriptional regulator
MGTIRQQIIDLLIQEALSALDISRAVGVAEKDVYRHLVHIEKTVAAQGRRLARSPISCRSCGFSFRRRRRLTRPGHCPRCRCSRIDYPLFRIEK